MGCVALCRLPSLARSAPSDSSSGTALAIGGRTWARQIETEVIISGFYFFEKASQEHEHVGNLDLVYEVLHWQTIRIFLKGPAQGASAVR